MILPAYRLISNPPPRQTGRNLTLVNALCTHTHSNYSTSLPLLQVVKVIQKLANTSHVRESYMKPLEQFVKGHNEELKVLHSVLMATRCIVTRVVLDMEIASAL